LLAPSLFTDTGNLAIHVELPHEFAWSIAAWESVGAGLLLVQRKSISRSSCPRHPALVDARILIVHGEKVMLDAGQPQHRTLPTRFPISVDEGRAG